MGKRQLKWLVKTEGYASTEPYFVWAFSIDDAIKTIREGLRNDKYEDQVFVSSIEYVNENKC